MAQKCGTEILCRLREIERDPNHNIIESASISRTRILYLSLSGTGMKARAPTNTVLGP